ncbi:MAG: glycosyltransferase family 1 protein [Chlamydiae bacterium]|nr:glycosyltransferase family 1 protein [Chlamydiota bacterium]
MWTNFKLVDLRKYLLRLVAVILYQAAFLTAENLPSKTYNVLIPTPFTGGEEELAMRLEIASKNLGWKGKAFLFRNDWSLAHPVKFVFDENQIGYTSLSQLFKNFDSDFIISLYPRKYSHKKIPNYLAMTRSHDENIRIHGKKLLQYDGYLCVPQKMDSFVSFLDQHGKKRDIIEWVPSCLKSEYKPLEPKKLFYCGVNWDLLRKSKPYHDCLRMLDETGLMDVYGTEGMKNWHLKSYKGELPYDGKSVTNAIKEAGVVLVLHSQEHLDYEVITPRIFEAAAAGSVIISDRHGFVTREFKDAVLYIDIDKDNKLPSDEMFRQIYTHLIWVLEHPVEAEKLARKAHSIFSAKFTLEDQLERLGRLHEKLQKELKNCL